MKSYKRIQALADAVAFASSQFDRKIVVADIGTDHGFVAEAVSKFDFTKKVIATDISEKSLSKLENLIVKNNLKNIETKVGDGLSPVSFADVAVIAGMGGFEISKIIDFQNRVQVENQEDLKLIAEEKTQNNNFQTEKTEKNSKFSKNIQKSFSKNQKKFRNRCNIFILQPAQNIVELRLWAMKHHYKILKDIVIKDTDRFYPILILDVSKFGFTKKSVFNLWIGRDAKENVADFNDYVVYLDEYLSFLSNVTRKRAKKDKILYQKIKLKKIVKKYKK